MDDLFQLNDWDFRRFVVVLLSLLLTFWGSIALEAIIFPIPLLRQISGFLLLTFVPGILLLRILRIHHIGAVRTTVYATGLSLATLMFTGFFMDVIYPLFGITHPLSLWPFVYTFSALVGILCFFAWIRDRHFAAPVSIHLHEILSPPVLALSLLPFGAITGTYLINFYDTNIIQMTLLLIIAVVPILILCARFIPKKYYPYGVFSLAITLLYHTALISSYIWGWDIQYEYHLVNLIIQNSFWDFTVYSNCNGMLSLVMLAPIYSILLGMRLEWVFKIIYPFFFALVPLGLYVLYMRQTNERIAFLACFFFMSLFVFYTEMLGLARQEIAEFFLVLILLSMFGKGLSKEQKSVLFLIFSASLVVSHYGLSYLFMFMLLSAMVIAIIEYYVGTLEYIQCFLNRMMKQVSLFPKLELQRISFKPSIIPLWLFIGYGLFLLTWYVYISNSSSFDTIVLTAHRILKSASSELFNPDAVQSAAIIINDATTPLREVTKYLNLIMILFIIFGFTISILIYSKQTKFDILYLLLSCGALALCTAGMVLPYFSSALNTSRLYQISLILLAPFGIIGGITLVSKLRYLSDSYNRSWYIVAIFLGIFLLFNCGWAYEVGHEESSFALNKSVDSPVFSKQEICGSLWLTDMKDDRPVIADRYRELLLQGHIGRPNCRSIKSAISFDPNYYIFLGQRNILSGYVTVTHFIGLVPSVEYLEISDFLREEYLIYDNGGSRIYCQNPTS